MKKFRISLLLMLAILLLLTGISYRTAEAEELGLAEAVHSYYNEEYVEARDILREIKVEPGEIKDSHSYQIHYYLVKTEIALRNYREAQNLIEELEESRYNPAELYWLLGERYLNRDGHFDSAQFDVARDMISKARDLGFGGEQQTRDLAHAEFGLENYQRAVELLDDVSEDLYRDSDYSILGRSHKELGNSREAINYFERLIVRDPDDAGAHLDLARVYLDLNDYAEAIDVLERGLERSPGVTSLRSQLGRAYFEAGEYDAALEKFDNVLETHRHNYEAHFYKGLIYLDREEYDRANESFEQAVRYNPTYVRAYIELGKLALERDNPYRAISQLTRAIEINPGYSVGYYHLGRVFYEIEMYQSAREELRKAVVRNPDIPEAEELLREVEDIIAGLDEDELEEEEMEEELEEALEEEEVITEENEIDEEDETDDEDSEEENSNN